MNKIIKHYNIAIFENKHFHIETEIKTVKLNLLTLENNQKYAHTSIRLFRLKLGQYFHSTFPKNRSIFYMTYIEQK